MIINIISNNNNSDDNDTNTSIKMSIWRNGPSPREPLKGMLGSRQAVQEYGIESLTSGRAKTLWFLTWPWRRLHFHPE